MKEQRIISVISFYGSLIMSSTSADKVFTWLWIGSSLFWLIKHIYLVTKKQ